MGIKIQRILSGLMSSTANPVIRSDGALQLTIVALTVPSRFFKDVVFSFFDKLESL